MNYPPNGNTHNDREIATTMDTVTDTGVDESATDVKQLIPVNFNQSIDEIISISSDESDIESKGPSQVVVVKAEPNSTWQHEKFLMQDEIRRLRIHCRALQDRVLNSNWGLPIASSTRVDSDDINSSAQQDKENNSKSD